MNNGAKAIARERSVLSKEAIDRAVGIIFFMWVMALSAYVYIPVPGTPVPITLQTFVVLLAGGLLARRDSITAMSGYLLLGFLGLPFFAAGSAGAAYLLGPTAGYLVGFIVAVSVIKSVLACLGRHARSSLAVIIAAMASGIAVIYAVGCAWLSMITHISWFQAWHIGALPFVAGDILKVIAAALIVRRVHAGRGYPGF